MTAQSANSAMIVVAEPLTRAGFAAYGSVVDPDFEVRDRKANANAGTAIKVSDVTEIHRMESSTQVVPNCNLFRCFTPSLLRVEFPVDRELTYEVQVLEKHPLSSQTFIPMGRNPQEFAFLVVVAEPQDAQSPDWSTVRAFLCRGNQAITYGAGVWHAPMVAIGDVEFTDFCVWIYEERQPSKPELDCIEVNCEQHLKEHHIGNGSSDDLNSLRICIQ